MDDSSTNLPSEPAEWSKSQWRTELRGLRKAQADRMLTSRRIAERLGQSSIFQEAAVVGWYVDAASEVATSGALKQALTDDNGASSERSRRHAVPYCADNALIFYTLESWNDLESGQFNILAPRESVRIPKRQVAPKEFDIVLVPAVGFDVHGNRLGQGKGFYDRFLTQLNPAAKTIGLAFDCQVVDRLPTNSHDQPVDLIVTQTRIIEI